MKNSIESKSYMDLAEDLAQEFENGENVHAGNIAYLEGFSSDSYIAYDYLMDRIAEMYAVTLRDTMHDKVTPTGFIQSIGRVAIGCHTR